jgi:hypothetical protein
MRRLIITREPNSTFGQIRQQHGKWIWWLLLVELKVKYPHYQSQWHLHNIFD